VGERRTEEIRRKRKMRWYGERKRGDRALKREEDYMK
jgi:hypothetical protein